jgi:hypothetical protein
MKRAGNVSLGALLTVLALAALVAVGFEIRSNELPFEPRTLCRAAARSAAESALARGRSRIAKEGSVRASIRGTLDGGPEHAEVTYQTEAKLIGRSWLFSARGTCTIRGERSRTVEITAQIAADPEARIESWRESP